MTGFYIGLGIGLAVAVVIFIFYMRVRMQIDVLATGVTSIKTKAESAATALKNSATTDAHGFVKSIISHAETLLNRL